MKRIDEMAEDLSQAIADEVNKCTMILLDRCGIDCDLKKMTFIESCQLAYFMKEEGLELVNYEKKTDGAIIHEIVALRQGNSLVGAYEILAKLTGLTLNIISAEVNKTID